MNKNICNILKEWKQEAGIKYSCLFQYSRFNNTICIYTSRPACFIGLHGTLYDKYKEKLKNEISQNIYVAFIETAPFTI